MTALENAVVVKTDAEIRLPEIGFTLTTRAARTAPKRFRDDVKHVFRVVRRSYPEAQYLGQVEFTTGDGARAGGARRIHQHGLLKGVPAEDVQNVQRMLRREWAQRTGAHRVEAHVLERPAGAIAYLVNHHVKSAQTPPRGWTGKRLRPSRGYYDAPITELRAFAQEQLRDKRLRREVDQLLAADGSWEALADDPESFGEVRVDALREARRRPPPRLVRVQNVPAEFDAEDLPVRWVTEVVGPVHE